MDLGRADEAGLVYGRCWRFATAFLGTAVSPAR